MAARKISQVCIQTKTYTLLSHSIILRGATSPSILAISAGRRGVRYEWYRAQGTGDGRIKVKWQYDLPWKVFLPVHLVVAKIKSILSDQPEAGSEGPTSLNIPPTMESIKLFPYIIPFHGAAWKSGSPQTGFHTPTVIITNLQGAPTKILISRRTPNHQSQRRIVRESIHYTDIVLPSPQVFWFLHRHEYYEPCNQKHHHKKPVHTPHLHQLLMPSALVSFFYSYKYLFRNRKSRRICIDYWIINIWYHDGSTITSLIYF